MGHKYNRFNILFLFTFLFFSVSAGILRFVYGRLIPLWGLINPPLMILHIILLSLINYIKNAEIEKFEIQPIYSIVNL